MAAFFDVPLNLPHAAKVSERIVQIFQARLDAGQKANQEPFAVACELQALLAHVRFEDDNPPAAESEVLRREAAVIGRRLVALIESGGLGADRLGQCVRNLFECLELGEEGAAISLRAGENPSSLQRPV